MRRFVFPLERVLEWRRARAEIERLALERLLGDWRRLREAAAELEAALARSRRALSEAAAAGQAIESGTLAALEEFAAGAKSHQRALRLRQSELGRQVEAQRERLAAARRDFRLIEKLRERARAAWERDGARELEKLASELHLARWEATQADR